MSSSDLGTRLLFPKFREGRCMTALIIVCVFLCTLTLNAQTPVVPSQLGTGPLTNEAERSNVLTYGTTISGTFDDNATAPTNPVDGEVSFSSSIQPQARLAVTRSRWSTNLFYGPSFTYNPTVSGYNSASHAAGAEFDYHFTHRLSLSAQSGFSLSSNPFQSFQAGAQLPQSGVLNEGNFVTPGGDVRTRTEQSQADLVYLLGPHISAGIGGNFNGSQYRNATHSTSVAAAVQNARSWSAHAFYSHQITRKYSFGIQYAARDSFSDSQFGQFSSLSHQVLGFVNIQVKPSIQLSVFAGPEFSSMDDNLAAPIPIFLHFRRTSTAGGSTFSWRGEHNGLSLSFVQQVGDSGTNGAGSVVVRTASLGLQHQITRLSTIGLNGRYISNNSFDPLGQVALSDSATAGMSYSRVLTPRVTLQITGSREQFMGTAPLGFRQRSYDLATVSLSYTLQRPIGR